MKRTTALLCLLLAGCTVPLVHDTKTEADLAADRYECRQQSYATGGLAQGALMAECLLARGWRKAPNQ